MQLRGYVSSRPFLRAPHAIVFRGQIAQRVRGVSHLRSSGDPFILTNHTVPTQPPLVAIHAEGEGNGYIGMPVPELSFHLATEWLKAKASPHITILRPPEIGAIVEQRTPAMIASGQMTRKQARSLIKQQLVAEVTPFLLKPPTYLGVGKVVEADNWEYFLAVNWPDAQQARASLELPPFDFHITIAFKTKDIHSVSKGPDKIIWEFPR